MPESSSWHEIANLVSDNHYCATISKHLWPAHEQLCSIRYILKPEYNSYATISLVPTTMLT